MELEHRQLMRQNNKLSQHLLVVNLLKAPNKGNVVTKRDPMKDWRTKTTTMLQWLLPSTNCSIQPAPEPHICDRRTISVQTHRWKKSSVKIGTKVPTKVAHQKWCLARASLKRLEELVALAPESRPKPRISMKEEGRMKNWKRRLR